MPSPTIVLVHGAFGDASSWRPVFDRLVDDGHTVLAPPNPLRGLPYDASYTASVIDQLDGPIVLVGTADYPVAPELHRFSYDRAGSTVTEVEGASHFLMLSQSEIVAGVIREAVIASAVNVAA